MTKIKMELGIGHYGHKGIPDAKFESGSSSSFGDMIISLGGKEPNHQIWLYPRKTGLT